MNGKAEFPLKARYGTFNKMSRCFLLRFHMIHVMEQLCHKNLKKPMAGQVHYTHGNKTKMLFI